MIDDHIVCPTCQTIVFLGADERDLAYIRCGSCLSNIPLKRSGAGGLVALAVCGAVVLSAALLVIVFVALRDAPQPARQAPAPVAANEFQPPAPEEPARPGAQPRANPGVAYEPYRPDPAPAANAVPHPTPMEEPRPGGIAASRSVAPGPARPESAAPVTATANDRGTSLLGVDPAAPGAPAVAPGASYPPISYHWPPGSSHAYSLKIEADLGSEIEQVSGSVSYTLRSVQRDPEFEREEQRATGTAFVIDSAGYLLTCEHVVRDAVSIDVVLGGQTYVGKVLAQDKSHDVALLKIEARGLPVISLADSDRVEQAQAVRAVGFPLSSVLGTSVKITGGAVAGTVRREDSQLFQIDASVNPGNSGGPLVNSQGHVVGVVNAKLSGEAISNVAFAIPSNIARKLLQDQHAPFQRASKGETLAGPALAKRVVPAVALVSVVLRPRRQDRLQLAYSGSFTTLKKEKRDQRGPGGFGIPRSLLRPPRASFAFPQHERGSLLIDVFGEVIEIESEDQLPYLQGPLSSFIFDPLPADGASSWHTRRHLTINRVQKSDATPFGIPRPPTPFGRTSPRGRIRSPLDRRGDSKTLSTTQALEDVRYAIHSRTPDVVVIRKHYELKSLEKSGAPSLDLQGEGELRFNTTLGAPESLVFKARIKRRADGKESETPLTISFTRVDIPKAKSPPPGAQSDNADQGQPEADPAAAGQESAEAKVDRLLKEIAEPGEVGAKYGALNSLSQIEPTQSKREAVLEQILPLLECGVGQVQAVAARVAQHWRLKQARDKLMGLLESDDLQSRWAAIDALGYLGDDKAAARLGQLCEKSSRDRFKTFRALEQIGEPAVETLVALLESDDGSLRIQVCRALAKIGGEKSEAAIKKIAQQDENTGVRKAAGLYLKRLGK